MEIERKKLKAVEALEEAHRIAFAPFVFQASVSLQRMGILDYIFNNREKGGPTACEISEDLALSSYGVGVLLEIAESSNIVSRNTENRFELTKVGYFLNYNPTTLINLNFTQDICYKGLYHLSDSIKNGKPEGLKELGNWNTIYEGLSDLSPEQKQSWFDFDHHYSDGIFEISLERVFKNQPKTIFDIGGNTGKFSIQCSRFNEKVKVKIIDLPGQLKLAKKNVEALDLLHRITFFPLDWLSENPKIPESADVIWMSQFLDCFSEEQIVKILSVCAEAMNPETELFIIETFTDRQKFTSTRFILEATSLYFTGLANGYSKMYSAEVMIDLIEKAGLIITEDNRLGEYHTMLICKKKNAE